MAQNKQHKKLVAQNKRARFEYEILEVLEAGIVLMGSEVKSIRQGRASINESHVAEKVDPISHTAELYLLNANISVYEQAHQFNHEPTRPRKLLVHKRQRNKFLGSIRRKGLTMVPLSMYFNEKGYLKIEIALGKGKKLTDKRETIKERDWNRDKARLFRNKD